MHAVLATLLDRLDSPAISGTGVIRWGCPVPSFGDVSTAQLATLGLNPSNREFLDDAGSELQGVKRRFHTLRSLGLDSWSQADARHLGQIAQSCRDYFRGNPYDRWFRRLDGVISDTASYYRASGGACHLDLVPYATSRKWTELTSRQHSLLLAIAADTLGSLLRDSPVRILVLNGQTVVDHFQDVAGLRLERHEMPNWRLQRQGSAGVGGYAYQGVVEFVSNIPLGREVLVLGFNHNLQSSFGVTTLVLRAIRRWLTETARQFSA